MTGGLWGDSASDVADQSQTSISSPTETPEPLQDTSTTQWARNETAIAASWVGLAPPAGSRPAGYVAHVATPGRPRPQPRLPLVSATRANVGGHGGDGSPVLTIAANARRRGRLAKARFPQLAAEYTVAGKLDDRTPTRTHAAHRRLARASGLEPAPATVCHESSFGSHEPENQRADESDHGHERTGHPAR